MYGELNRITMSTQRKQRILNYWYKIIMDKNAMLYQVYNHNRRERARDNVANWASCVRDLLYEVGVNNYWLQ